MLQFLPVNINTYYVSDGAKQTVFFPQVNCLKNLRWQMTVNDAIIVQVKKMMIDQNGDIPTTVEEVIGNFEIKNNQRQVLSLTLKNYTYHEQAAHGMTVIKSLTFDMLKEEICLLKDLFLVNSNYIERISSIIKAQIQARDIPLIEEFTRIESNQDFYIADKALVIYFQLYDLTPYVFGFPMFPISVYELADIIDENGPLGRMMENN